MRSVWQETELPQFPKLDGDVKTDVLIIGGGLAGILTAYFLRQKDVPYILAEKGRICSGNTQNTTAKITAQHGLIYNRIMKTRGRETAQKYLQANLAAAREYERLCSGIECGYEHKDSYVYSKEQKKLEDEMSALEKLNFPAELSEALPLPVSAAGAVKFPNQAQFNVLEFIAETAKKLNIYENTFVREMKGCTALTDGGRIEAKYAVCAAHFPLINKHGGYFLKLYQHRSYVIALENAPDVGGMYVDEKEDGLSFRNYKGLLFLGGAGGRTGKKHGGWQALRSFAEKNYPQAREKYFWAAQDCMSLDGIPYIGRYSRRTPDFFVETGFNKWGMTGAMLSAIMISDMLTGEKNGFEEVFSPSRSIMKPQLIINAAEAAAELFIPAKKRCPHMGCALKRNREEGSWDCACHGSRFSDEGRLLDNPANGDLPKQNNR